MKKLTLTNLLVSLCVVVYVFDKYIFPSNANMFDVETIDSLDYLLGFCGGNVFQSLCFYNDCIADGEPWRVITFLFIHAFIFHLVTNMIALAFVGNHLEKKFGRKVILFFFLWSGIIGIFITNFLPFLDTSQSLAGGASGGIFGLMGMDFIYCILKKGRIKSISKIMRIYLAFYGIVFTYSLGMWTICAHNISFAIGFLSGLCLFKSGLLSYQEEDASNERG